MSLFSCLSHTHIAKEGGRGGEIEQLVFMYSRREGGRLELQIVSKPAHRTEKPARERGREKGSQKRKKKWKEREEKKNPRRTEARDDATMTVGQIGPPNLQEKEKKKKQKWYVRGEQTKKQTNKQQKRRQPL
jgi:hypothetical protein